jgi:hypothetical protein
MGNDDITGLEVLEALEVLEVLFDGATFRLCYLRLERSDFRCLVQFLKIADRIWPCA